MSQIFINYRRDDSAFVAILLDEILAARFGRDNVFRDSRSIELGFHFDERIRTALRTVKVMFAVIGPQWITIARDGVRRLDEPGDYVRLEIEHGLSLGIPVIPVLVADTPMPAAAKLPDGLKELVSRQYIRLYPRTVHRDLPALLSEVAAYIGVAGVPDAPTNPGVCNLTSRLVPFVGRRELLRRVRETLESADPVVACALSGIGGVGKTQLALEYAHTYAVEYDVIWWINSEHPELIPEQLAALGVALGLVDKSTDTRPAAVAVVSRLHRLNNWLLVFDNAPDAEAVHPWLPAGPGHILITSRSHSWVGAIHPLTVEPFARRESIEFVRATFAPAALLADEIADRLADLPLALAQAIGVMAENAMSATELLQALRQATIEVLDAGKPANYDVSLAGAVRLAFGRLAAASPSAARCASACALLAPEPIPLPLLSSTSDSDPKSVMQTRFSLRRDISLAARYGLLQLSGDAVVMHRLTQEIIAGLLTDEQRDSHKSLVHTLVSAAAPTDTRDPRSWLAWSKLLPHLLAVTATDVGDADLRATFRQAMLYLRRRGEWQLAHQLTQQCLQRWRTELGEDHLDVLGLAGALCASLWLLGEYPQALSLGEATLARLRSSYGENHPETLRCMSGVATTLLAMGEYQRASELHEAVLQGRQHQLGLEHVDTLQSANSAAHSLRSVGDLERAQSLAEDTWLRRRRVLGENHPDTLHSANNLAVTLRCLGRYDQAQSIDEDTLRRRRRVLGENHPITVQASQQFALISSQLASGDSARGAGLTCYCERVPRQAAR